MFDRQFFINNQKLLLWLLNKPIIRLWFRRVMRIDYRGEINRITPNSYTFDGKLVLDGKKLKFVSKTDFRAHNKYSKRLYYGFLWLWRACHLWDMVSNGLNLNLNLGFDHTYYPEAGSGGGNTTCDGWVQYYDADGVSWATIHDAASDSADATSDPVNWVLLQSDDEASKYRRLHRGILTIDTSDLGTSDIELAVFSIKGTAKGDPAPAITPNMNIYSANPASNNALVGADYNKTNFGTTAYCNTAITYDNWNTSAYNDFTFNATGLAAIAKTGITKLGIRNANYDVANSAPILMGSAVTSYLMGSSADAAGTSSDPKLVITSIVTITVPSAANLAMAGQASTIEAIISLLVSNTANLTITGNTPVISISGGYLFQDKHTGTWTFQSKS